MNGYDARMVALTAALVFALLPQDPQEHWTTALAALRREGERAGTFGPTGPRLWITRAEARPGLIGDAHWLHHGTLAAAAGEPLAVTMRGDDGEPLALRCEEQAWFPDHATLRYSAPGVASIEEARWIACDADVFVSRFTIRGPAKVRVTIDSRLAQEPAGDASRFAPVSIGALATVDLARDPRLRRGAPDGPVWIEGENFVEQSGSTGRDRKRAASGGELLGRDFGGDAGDFAVWRAAGTGAGEWELWLRYARASSGDAAIELGLPDREPLALDLPPTGGWGDETSQFALRRVAIGALPDRIVELRLTVRRAGSNLNVDGLLLAPRGAFDESELARRNAANEWPDLDPLRGAVVIVPGPQVRGGVPFDVAQDARGNAVAAASAVAPWTIAGAGERLHVLATPFADGATLRLGPQARALGPRRPGDAGELVSFCVDRDAALDLRAEGAVVIAVTRERDAPRDAILRRGRITAHGVTSEIGIGLFGAREDELVDVPTGATRRVYAVLEFAGTRRLGDATRDALAPIDPLAAHRASYARWFAEQMPRFVCGDVLWTRLWTYRAFVMRHNLAEPGAGWLPGPVFFEGRHGSWYPQVITFSAPHIVAETRWLEDPRYWRGNVEAHCVAQQDDGVYPNLLVDRRLFRYTNWLPSAALDALAVHPDRALGERLLDSFVHDVRGNAKTFDPDGDGLLDPRDHYATGMEFQPSFWFHQGYDDSKPATDLERVDFTTYQAANAAATAQLARMLGKAELAVELDAAAAKARDALLAKCWHAEDGFFHSLRASDDDPARCKEVIGFYPFRFGLVPDEPSYDAALRALVDPNEFWTPFPIASAARSVPVFTPHVQQWPGPGGVVTACMWNGPTWPHANSLTADAMASVVRTRHAPPFAASDLGVFLDRFARFHAEDGDAGRFLIREYGDGESGVNWGCADYFHSTWCDLLIRHLGGLVPRHDGVLEIRPLALFAPDDPRATFRFEDLPYHGRRIGIEVVRGTDLIVRLDGVVVARGDARAGVQLDGALAAR